MLVQMRKVLDEIGVTHKKGCVGHPIVFEGASVRGSKRALGALREAFSYAEFSQQRFFPEPIAATLSYLYSHAEQKCRRVLCVDFGGGTLDLSVLVRRPNGSFEVVGTKGVGLGGDHIDQRMFQTLLFQMLGQGETWRRQGESRLIETPFPFEHYEAMLLNWGITYMLNRNRYTAPIYECIEHGSTATRTKFLPLLELIQYNRGYVVFQKFKELKIALSKTESALLDIPELDIEISLTRQNFDAIISHQIQILRHTVESLLNQIGIKRERKWTW